MSRRFSRGALRAPARCSTVPARTIRGRNEGGRFKLKAVRRIRAGHRHFQPPPIDPVMHDGGHAQLGNIVLIHHNEGCLRNRLVLKLALRVLQAAERVLCEGFLNRTDNKDTFLVGDIDSELLNALVEQHSDVFACRLGHADPALHSAFDPARRSSKKPSRSALNSSMLMTRPCLKSSRACSSSRSSAAVSSNLPLPPHCFRRTRQSAG